MAASNDPLYASVTSDDGAYDHPSPFLDRVPQRPVCGAGNAAAWPGDGTAEQASEQHHPLAEATVLSTVEDSGDYATVPDFTGELEEERNGGANCEDGANGGTLESDEDYEEAKTKSSHVILVRQSQIHGSNQDEDDGKIYVRGNIVHSQPMLSFKSRGRVLSREELEEEGIYQGLTTTDEQKQQIGIMPESIYMTVNLETSRDALENMSMELGETQSRPG